MRRYRDYNTYLREIFGERVQKIPLDAGFNCPNRDGTLSFTGCVFCDRRGSGTGAMLDHGRTIGEQVVEGIRHGAQRYGARKFIAYFQSFTNTYGAVPLLKEIYDKALVHEGIVGLSIGTRPDCVNREVLDLLGFYRERYLVWIELGLQSAHDATLQRINRGHDVAAFEKAVLMADRSGLNVCAHVILGLPGETPGMMRQTARYVGGLPLEGVKIHLLYVVRDTPLAKWHQEGIFQCLEREEYVDLVVDFLERIPPAMVVQRLTGDPFGVDLVAPLWAKEKTGTLHRIRKRLEERDTWQGKKHGSSIAGR
ncbi:MAG: TIGR01212 family radical SAM protein [Deltaproteobacteria bacterium]|nr:TIGR01212 family radical SAM protein [Deltaproteobacteria bacterium]